MHKVSVGTKCPRGFLDRWLPEDDPALLNVRRRAAEGREIVAAIEKVRKVFLECTFDGCVVGLFSGDNDDGNLKRVVKSLGIDDVESCEGRS